MKSRGLAVALVSVAMVALSGAPARAADCAGPVNFCPTLGLIPIGPIPVGPIQLGPIERVCILPGSCP